MAVVKFVSDKDCQVFIDMELVGKVTPGSMLKVTLETGGYIIQVKDEDDNLIKEYDLEINPSDNQLLQKIDGVSNKLDDTIENLKNDSSLVFHCDRASFCHNGLYGFIDKKLNVVIPPIYYSVNEFVDDKAFVVRDFPKGRKTTMIDSDGNLFFNRWFDFIGESDETILLGIDNRIIVYSKTKCDKIAEYFNAGYDHKYPIVPVFKKDGHDELYGFINYKGEEVVPFLFDKVENFDEKGYSKVSFWGIQSKIEQESFKLIDDIGNKYEIKSFDNLVSVYNECGVFNKSLERIEKYEDNRLLFKTVQPLLTNGKWTLRIITEFHNDNTSIVKDIECDKVIFLGDRCYVYRIGNQCFVYYFDSEEEIAVDADFIIPANRCVRACGCAYDEYYPDTFITRKNGKYGTVDMNGNEVFPITYSSIVPVQPNYFIDIYTQLPVYAILRKDNKYSLANLSIGEIYLPFEYDNIVVYRSSGDCKETIFKLHQGEQFKLFCIEKGLFTDNYDSITILNKYDIVQKDNKYGIISDLEDSIIPIEYALLYPIGIGHTNYIISIDGSTFALGNIKKKEIYFEYMCDEISVLCEGLEDVFLIRKDDKYGCLSCNGILLVSFEYDKIEVESHDSSSFPLEKFKLKLYKEENFSYHFIEV